MTKYRIERGIPMPRQRSRIQRDHSALAAALRRMRAGDSIMVPDTMPEIVRVTASRIGREIGGSFATRQVPGGVRVWLLPARMEDKV
jgi:hypothetical protein